MKYFLKFLFLGVLVINLGCKQQSAEEPSAEEAVAEVEEAAPVISSDTTKDVLVRHLEAFGANDLSGIMADYAEGAVLVTPDSTYTGQAAIEGLFTGLFPAFPAGETIINLDKMVIDNELAFIVWNGDTPVFNVPFATDTFVIVDGKIQKQTFAGVLNPKE
jgi:hypothetical protein